ncbi:MAG TPA: ABC transporter substrate-binding protein [Candidatus Acidoferrales bacterium]|nr:ABC transporter substrate-binding protein [Candidatus Acidoferrales bacterium]
MKMRVAYVLLVTVLTIAGAGSTAAQETPAVTIAASTFDSTTTGLYAVKAGLFKKAGLNVTFVPMNPSAILPAVAGGTIQIANSNLLNVIEAHARHVPFTVVAPSAMFNDSDVNGYVGLVVSKDSTARTGRDFNGKTLAVPSINDLNTIASKAWIDKNGGDSSSVHYIEMPPTAALPAVTAGRVDATILTTPFLMQAVDGGSVRVVTDAYTAISKQYLGLGWFTTEDFAAKNRDVIERFVRVMHDAAVYCNAHQAQTSDMMAELAKQDPTVVRRMKRVLFAQYLTAPLIQPLVDVAAKYKVIDASFNAQELISPYALKPPR